MDRTITIIRYQWRAYWRRLSRGGKTSAGNQGIVLILFGLGFVRYLMFLRTASINLSQGKTGLLEKLLLGIFFAWLFPLIGAGQSGFVTRRWRHLPLSLKELFRLRVFQLLMPPASWIVIAASLLICYPLAHAQRPFAGTCAALLFVATAALTGITLSHLIGIAIWRKVFVAAAVGLVVASALYSDGDPRNLLQLTKFLPSILVAHAAAGKGPWLALAVLAGSFVAACFAAAWSLHLSLATTESRNAARGSTSAPFSIPGRLGPLVAKDFRYSRRLLDVYLGWPLAAAGCVYLISAGAPTRGIFLTFVSIVFLFGAALPFNNFGLDTRAGLNRYALLPLAGRSILLSKNLAYAMIMSVQLLPLILLGAWRMGPVAGVLGLVTAVASAGAYLAWGNWMSVSHPLKMQFYSFASSGAALADALAGVVFGSLPGILIIYLLNAADSRAVGGKIALVVLLFGGFYWLSLKRFGSRFERRRETIARALS